MSQPLKALLIEDSDDDAVLICRSLERGDFTVAAERVQTRDTVRLALEHKSWDVIIADFRIAANFTGLDALKMVREMRLDTPFLIVSGVIGEERAVEAMRSGANDFIMKDPRLARLAPAVRRELQEAESRRARRTAEEKLQAEYAFRATIEKTIPSGIAVSDPQGKITYVNPAFCRLVGWSEANLIGSKPPYIFWPRNAAGAYLEEFWRLVKAASEPRWLEFELQRSNSDSLHVLTCTTPMKDAAGLQTGWLTSFTDITQLKRIEKALHELNEQLEQRVAERTSDLNRALADLQQAVADRKRLENELLEIVEKERKRLGLELHDDLGQRLSGLMLMTKALQIKLDKRKLSEVAEANRIHSNLEEAINLTRGMARNLVPWNFSEGSLVQALRSLAAQNQKLFAIPCSFKPKGEVPPLTPEKEMHLYKIAQEAVNNGIKHGKPSKVQICLEKNSSHLRLSIKNNGRPFPAIDKLSAGAGLRIMNYRASVIGAQMDVHPTPRGGTEVACTLPL